MTRCPECSAELPAGALGCSECGADLTEHESMATTSIRDADFDPEREREEFERRYGIDIGERTVDEFLAHLDQQDYSLTKWFWLVVATEVAGVAAFVAVVFGDLNVGTEGALLFGGVSALLALSIFVDTRVVGLFERWAKIRWTYIVIAAIPLVAHLAGLFYLVLRRLKEEQAFEQRQRLTNAGFDISPTVGFSDD